LPNRWIGGLAALALLLSAVACSDSTDPGPVPSSIRLDQAALSVADGESVRLTATVLDQHGNPLSALPAGTTLTWSSADPAVATVSAGFVTGNRPGTTDVTAAVGTASASARLTVTQVARAIEVAAGNGQQGLAGEELTDSITLRVVDRHGSGVPGVQVIWEVTSGSGSLSGETHTTDASGRARAAWRLGTIGGTQTVTVRSPGIAGVATVFSATAFGDPASPFISSITPAILEPGATAVITGGNFDRDPGLTVLVAGAAAAIREVGATQLTIQLPTRAQLPCRPLTEVEVSLTGGGFTSVRAHPLRAGIARKLAVGASLILNGADDLACNEFEAGRYVLSTFNSNPVLGASATLELRGSAAAGATAAAHPHSTAAAGAVGVRSPRLPDNGEGAAHTRILEGNREILRSLSPAYRERRARGLSIAPSAAPALAVGDTVGFRVPKTSVPVTQACSSFDQVRGRVVYAGLRAVVFEDVAAPLAGTMDATYVSIGQEYENTMHSLLLENFGDPLALGSELRNSEQVYMLFTRAVNDDNPDIAGFVFSGDLFPREQCASSDRSALFYANVPTVAGAGTGQGTAESWRWTMRSTIIHEVKHITSFAERLSRNALVWEEAWLEESTARVSEELWARKIFGYAQGERVSYSQSIYCEVRPSWPECQGLPYVMLKHFSGLYSYLTAGGARSPLGSTGTTDASFYGSGWSLVRWAIDQSTSSEAAFLRALTQERELSGVGNLQARSGRTLAETLPRWSLSLATAGIPGFQPQQADFTFPSWNVADVFASMHSDFPNSFTLPSPQRISVGTGSFERPAFALRGGAAAVFELQPSSQVRTVQLRGGAGLDPSTSVGLAVLRLN
jgi:hypothetical protein